jgi:hypothetical protein
MSDPGQVNERGDGGPGALDLHPETIVLDRDGALVLAVFGFNQAGVAQIRPAYVRIS